MASTTDVFPHETTTDAIPHYGTYNARANMRYPEGVMCGRDASGRAYNYTDADTSGFPALGVNKSYIMNATGDAAGGLDDSIVVEVAFGVFGFPHIDAADPLPGDDMYVVDNWHLSRDSLNGARGFAGKCVEVQTNQGLKKVYTMFSPVGARGGTGAQAEVRIPLTSFVDSDGDPLAKFANGASAVPGFNLGDSEAFGIRWNNNATFEAVLTQIGLPLDVDADRPVYVDVEVSKTGATLADATTFTLTAFLTAIGDLHDADANAGSVSAAITGDAAAKTTQLVTFTITAANVPALVRSLTMTLKPTDGTLGTDDVIVHDVRIRYTRK